MSSSADTPAGAAVNGVAAHNPPEAASAEAVEASSPPPEAPTAERLLAAMVERLLGAMSSGPSMNCRPHSSRQRLDLTQLSRLGERGPGAILHDLLGQAARLRLTAAVEPPPASVLTRARQRAGNGWRRGRRSEAAPEVAPPVMPVPQPQVTAPLAGATAGETAEAGPEAQTKAPHEAAPEAPAEAPAPAPPEAPPPAPEQPQDPLSPEERAAVLAWEQQHAVLNKLRAIAEDARTYEQDTGVPALSIGFPLLSLPAGSLPGGGGGGFVNRRVLAPVAFVPLHLLVRAGPKTTIDLQCRGEGAERVQPNDTLLVWLAQRAGGAGEDDPAELFVDSEGADPWRELRELVRHVAAQVGAAVPAMFETDAPPAQLELTPAPTAEQADDLSKPTILPAAVLGLYPTANQGLLRDAQAMAAGESLEGPVRSFVFVGERLGDEAAAPALTGARQFETERLVAPCDPCQMQAVRLARTSRGLVVHGPPGTGKSQTITNVIADHLARRERVLFVCDKRTALDVVYNRLEHIGLGELCALIHDPQRDRSDFYRKVREQLDSLADKRLHPSAARKLEQIDQELSQLHAELTAYHAALLKAPPAADPPMSLHDLIGRWMQGEDAAALLGVEDRRLSADVLSEIAPRQLEAASGAIRDALERGRQADWPANPWRDAAGWSLPDLLARPMEDVRKRLAALVSAAESADATRHDSIPPFDKKVPLPEQAATRVALAERLKSTEAGLLEPSAGYLVERPAEQIADARLRIGQVQAHAAFVRKHGLPEAELAARTGALTAADAAQRRDALKHYVDGFAAVASRLAVVEAAAITAGAGGEARGIALHWLAVDDAARDRARRQLQAAAPLAEQVSRGAPDPSLMRQYRRQPFDAAELLRRRAAVAEYETAASGLLGFLAFGRKKAAAPTLQFFGLNVSVASARQVRQFLDDLRARIDLAEALEETLPEALRPTEADDALLLQAFGAHRSVLLALAAPAPAADAGASVDAALVEAIQAVMPEETKAARVAVEPLGLTLAPADAERARRYYTAVVAVEGLRGVVRRLLPEATIADEALAEVLAATDALLASVEWLVAQPAGPSLVAPVAGAVRGRKLPDLLDGLRRSPGRVEAILALDAALAADRFVAEPWRQALDLAQRKGDAAAPAVAELRDRADTLEAVLRVREHLRALPALLAAATSAFLDARTEPESALSALQKQTDAAEIRRRLSDTPELQSADAKRLRDAFERYRALQKEKYGAVRDAILHEWTSRQKERLLAATGSRLNGTGADLRRRLAIRGKKVMRLRQMVRAGQAAEGGDALFDLCPIWMASPETVAQVFARQPVFDVVVFDEASQVRLEESLPVLTRGRRVVIAGDPKQLPPTRFFESAIATSEQDEAESDQELFEAQQSETEDLLSAALGLDIQQCFLDVHYRSRNADLIGFSNEHFYGSRLQPIPGHPKNRTLYAPVRLYQVEGVYEDRENAVEAEQVVKIVRDLLKWAEPPSIGIACFNLPQRDLILEKLDDAAAADAGFARRLAEARERRGAGSFEGLFVKNLENVQGDERDHIVISTTYGRDAEGRFRRNFGPVSQAGGGRRLNVLVTRARSEVHLVTSIPPAEYRQLPPVPEGQQATGRWLLYAYLHYAEQLKSLYEQDAADDSEADAPAVPAAPAAPEVRVLPSQTPSQFAEALAARLRESAGIGSDVYWGNEGFGIDVVLKRPAPNGDGAEADEVTVGLLCDMTRFGGTDDPVEWEAFRTVMHEGQGWPLERIWSPHAFRDPAGTVRWAASAHQRILHENADSDPGGGGVARP